MQIVRDRTAIGTCKRQGSLWASGTVTIGTLMSITNLTRLSGLVLMSIAGTTTNADDAGDSRLITDFTDSSADLGWYVLNDNVMGGRSDGDFRIEDGRLHFEGRTNTVGGGFSSIRTEPLSLDLSAYDGIRLRVHGDGRRYTWRLTTDARYYGRPVGYWADFETRGGEWQTVDVPFSRFVPRFRGSRLSGPPLDTGTITGMGLMIYDKRDGVFDLELAGVNAYSAGSNFSFGPYRWDKRLLVVSAPAESDERLVEQLRAIDARRGAFDERDMLLVTLIDDGSSTAGEEALSTADVSAARAALAIRGDGYALRLIGKDGGVKLASEAPVSMDEVYALIDGMPMRQREMEER